MQNMGFVKIYLVLLLLLSMTACSPLLRGLETPVVNVTSFRALPGESIVPTFEIGLQVANPNRVPLKLQGMTYSVTIEGHRVLNGIANQLPVIEAYGEGEVLLQVRPDLFSTLNLFNRLLNQPQDQFSFNLEAVLDAGGLMPKIRVTREGRISLTGDNHSL